MRAILDTNIFVSCLLGGKLEAILDSLKAGRFTIVVSDDIVSEYNEVLRRPKFGFTEADVDDVMHLSLIMPSLSFRPKHSWRSRPTLMTTNLLMPLLQEASNLL